MGALLGLLDSLTSVLSEAWWTYPLIAAIVAGDAVLPVLPGETAVITGGVLSAAGSLSLPLVVLVGAIGAFAGDSVTFLLGSRAGPWARRHLFSGRSGAGMLTWAEGQLDVRGGSLVVVARFIPGGRTATAFVAGATDFTYRRFARSAALGALLWSLYAGLIGRIGGAAFEGESWKAVLVALVVAVGGMAAIEVVRARLSRRRPVPLSSPGA